jgi:hypothetical protein
MLRQQQQQRADWEGQRTAQFQHLTNLLEVLSRQLTDPVRATATAPSAPASCTLPKTATAAPAATPSGLPAVAAASLPVTAVPVRPAALPVAFKPAAPLPEPVRYRSRRNRRGNSRA